MCTCSLELLRMMASSSSASAPPPPPPAELAAAGSLPTWLVEWVSAARPRCAFFNTRHGCRKGMKCPRLPDEPGRQKNNRAHLLYVSRIRTPAGEDKLMIRPPLHDALVQAFLEAHRPLTLESGVQWQHNNAELMTYQLTHMRADHAAACEGTSVS